MSKRTRNGTIYGVDMDGPPTFAPSTRGRSFHENPLQPRFSVPRFTVAGRVADGVVSQRFQMVFKPNMIIAADDCIVAGSQCIVFGDRCLILGKDCTVNGSDCIVMGSKARINGKQCFVTSDDCTYSCPQDTIRLMDMGKEQFELMLQRKFGNPRSITPPRSCFSSVEGSHIERYRIWAREVNVSESSPSDKISTAGVIQNCKPELSMPQGGLIVRDAPFSNGVHQEQFIFGKSSFKLFKNFVTPSNSLIFIQAKFFPAFVLNLLIAAFYDCFGEILTSTIVNQNNNNANRQPSLFPSTPTPISNPFMPVGMQHLISHASSLRTLSLLSTGTTMTTTTTTTAEPTRHIKKVRLSSGDNVNSTITWKQRLDPSHDIPGESCVICMEREKKVFVDPCGHTSFCITCSKELMNRSDEVLQCPLCNTRINFIKETF